MLLHLPGRNPEVNPMTRGAMKRRQLGARGLKVSEIGFGCMGLNSTCGYSLAKQESIVLIRSAVDLGVTFFDTAEIYGPFTNEAIVGEPLRNVCDQITIATKFGFAIDAATETNTGLSSTRSCCDPGRARAAAPGDDWSLIELRSAARGRHTR